MDVKHRLTGARTVVLHDTETGLGITVLAGNLAGFPEGVSHKRIILRGHVQAIDKMSLRQHQQVQWRLRTDILNHEELLVLEHLL